MKKPFSKFLPLLCAMGAFCLCFCILAAFINWQLFGACVVLSVVLMAAVVLQLQKVGQQAMEIVNCLQFGMASGNLGAAQDFPMPIAVLNNQNQVVWHNQLFYNLFSDDPAYRDISQLIEGFHADIAANPKGTPVTVGERYFYAFLVKDRKYDSDLNTLYLFENTRLRRIANEYARTRPAILNITVDNYEDVLGGYKDSERSRILGQLEQIIEEYIGKTSGILIKLNTRRYVAIVEKRDLRSMKLDRFSLLDTVRTLLPDTNNPLTLSMGVSVQGKSLAENMEIASLALDMALGRGGDQVALRTENGYEFFGGVARGVERRTKVKSRVIARSLSDLVAMCQNVIVMGHKFADLDALGSAAAMARCLQKCGKNAHVVYDHKTSLANVLYDRMCNFGYSDLFITSDKAEDITNQNTLVIVTDTHTADMVQDSALLAMGSHKAIIDHHRRRVDCIGGATVFYHEPGASSASEMVTELLSYLLPDNQQIESVFADGLMAGIALDTKNYAMKTGVRTFEAAATLRGWGADTIEVKKMFSTSLKEYSERTKLVTAAKIYKGCAISYCNEVIENVRVVSAQAADELLEINNILASFVLYKAGSGVNISARSMGQMNVQVVLEKMGGGGHHTMAGAQLADTTPQQAIQMIKEGIDAYLNKTEAEAPKPNN